MPLGAPPGRFGATRIIGHMDAIASHAASLPAIDDRWVPKAWSRDELALALVDGGVAGPVVSHPMDNVLRNIRLLCEGDDDKLFGMTGLQTHHPHEVLDLVATSAGFPVDPEVRAGPVPVDPHLVLDACEALGDRLAHTARRGERVVLATGHPVGLAHLYVEVGRLLRARGATVITPHEGVGWVEPDGLRRREVRYLHGVALLVDRTGPRHTHSGEPMRRMLEEDVPDLVFADHGWAGAAIERGVETVSIADVNDPALILARAQGRTEHVVVMDDNVRPDDYWPCFQAIAARFR